MVDKRVHKVFLISMPNRVTLVDLIELDMLDFDIIFVMDKLHACFASIYCRIRVVKFQFPSEPIIVWKGGNPNRRGKIISCLEACKLISIGCLYHILRVMDIEYEVPRLESLHVDKEFPEVFPDYINEILPNRRLPSA